MAFNQARFENKIDRTGDHHIWLGAKTPSGVCQIRINGKLRSAAQVSWEIERGELKPGSRVLSCVDEPLCMNVEHLTLDDTNVHDESRPRGRAEPGAGSKKETSPGKWKLTASAGRDDNGHRRRITRTVHGSRNQADRALASLIAEVNSGTTRPEPKSGTISVGELVDWYLVFAADVRGLEHSTIFGYGEVFDKWLRANIGHINSNKLKPIDVDKAFAAMRQAGMSHSRMNNARALLSGAYKWGRRHEKTTANPLLGFEIPASARSSKNTATPELEELVFILNGADEHKPQIAPLLRLAATTGMRRGELAGLRRSRLHLERFELTVDTSVNDAGGTVVMKPTKTKQSRVVSLDEGSVAMLLEHLEVMDTRAAATGIPLADDPFVFSLDPSCGEPMRPEYMTRHMRLLRKWLGVAPGTFDATILALRKWTSTELMDAGFNPSAVSGRQGHSVQVMLKHYSSRRRSADQAAAAHLGNQVYPSQRL